MAALASRYLGLFTAAPSADAGTGGTEVSGTGCARVQVAGALTAAAAFTTASTSWALAGAASARTSGSGEDISSRETAARQEITFNDDSLT